MFSAKQGLLLSCELLGTREDDHWVHFHFEGPLSKVLGHSFCDWWVPLGSCLSANNSSTLSVHTKRCSTSVSRVHVFGDVANRVWTAVLLLYTAVQYFNMMRGFGNKVRDSCVDAIHGARQASSSPFLLSCVMYVLLYTCSHHSIWL